MIKTVRTVLLVGGFCLLAMLLLAGFYSITKVPESVFVSRMKVGEMSFTGAESFSEAVDLLDIKAENFLERRPVEWQSVRGDIGVSMQDLGVTASITPVGDELLNFMTQATWLEKWRVLIFGKTINIPLHFDKDRMKTIFDEANIEQGVKDASYIYVDSHVAVEPEQIGYGLDLDALTQVIQNFWDNGMDIVSPYKAELPLRVREPDVRTTTLEALLTQADSLAARTIDLRDEFGNNWQLAFKDHMDLLLPGDTDAFDIQEIPFISFVELELVPDVEEDPASATILENEDGSYSFEGSARFGRAIDKLQMRLDLEKAIADESVTVLDLPISQVEPDVSIPDSLKVKGVTGLIGYGYSSFKGSPKNRIINVNRGFAQFNGVLVEQGTEFSFTSLMGPIDAAHGWLPELVIKGNETIPEYGGGLCQVSSTMFRAALYTGMPITARKNHSYAVSYYAVPFGYGLDATVYDPNPNLKFMNDTPGAILIQGYTEGTEAFFVFYGTNDRRTVQMEGPYAYDYSSISEPTIIYTDALAPGERKLDEYSHTGFKVDWYRTVIYPENSTSTYAELASGIRENIHSAYEARPAKYLEGSASTTTAE